MVFPAFIKITLFYCVGAVHYKMHKDFVHDIEGAGRIMPIVFTVFTVASLGLMGVPPFAGFSSKWLLATACTGLASPLGYIGAAALIASAILTGLYLMEIVMLAFFPRQNRIISVKVPRRARRDPNYRMTVPLVVLTAASVLLGLCSGYVVDFIQKFVII